MYVHKCYARWYTCGNSEDICKAACYISRNYSWLIPAQIMKKTKLKLKTSTFSLCIFSLRRCIVRKVLPRIQSKKIIWTYPLSMKMIKEMIIILVYSFERKISWIGKCPSKPIVIVDVMDIGYFNFQHQSQLTGTSLETFLVWWSLHHCRFLSHTYTDNLKKNNVLVDFLIFHNFGRKS